ncbi:MAG TPA: SMC-Scp complex subunit ScpB [Kofleriaceae bacterium]|nr:SMC-Scp complex subunit ScpB [Kofleriaceae bacterium]
MSGTRKKRKARGRAERAALEAVAAQAGVEVADDAADAVEAAAAEAPDEAAGEATEAAAAEAQAAVDAAVDAVEAVAEAVEAATDGLSASGTWQVADTDVLEEDPATASRLHAMAGTDAVAIEDAGSGEVAADGEDEGNVQRDAAADGEVEGDAAADGDVDGDIEGDDDADGLDDEAAASTPQAAQLDEERFTALIEALLFASDKPLTVARLRQLTRVSDTGRIQQALERIGREHAERGIVLSHVSGGYSFRTHSAFSPWVQQLIQGRPVRLSRAQLETLAIVAYRQPITRPEIDQIRGVDSGATLKLLLDRQLIRILGKREEVGRPLLYGTTKEFLDFFSLNDLRELPTLREYSELSDESRSVVEKLGMTPPPPPAAEPEAAPAEVGGEPEPAAEASADAEPVAEASADAEPAAEASADAEPAAEASADAEPAVEASADAEPAVEASADEEAAPVAEADPVADAEADPVADAEAALAAEPDPDPVPEAPPPPDAIAEEPDAGSSSSILASPDPDSFDSTGDGTLS